MVREAQGGGEVKDLGTVTAVLLSLIILLYVWAVVMEVQIERLEKRITTIEWQVKTERFRKGYKP
jgi:hypothetical protein